MKPRERRLSSDFEKMKSEFSNHPYISFRYDSENSINPVKYFVTYRGIKSYKLSEKSGKESKITEETTEHEIEIYLHADYPRIKPQCFILTDIFHPNFRKSSPNDICIGDYWAPGETLVDIVYQIGEMIMFQNYNVNSPLNGIAAKWAKENENIFPSDRKDLRLGEVDIVFKSNEPDDIEIDLKS